MEFKKKLSLAEFSGAIADLLGDWVKDALAILIMDGSPVRDRYKATAALINYSLFLRSINSSIEHLRRTLKDLYEEYKDIEKQAQGGDLSGAFLRQMQLDRKLGEAVTRAQGIGEAYYSAITEVKKSQKNYRALLSEKNETAIKFLTTLTVETLHKLIVDADMAGF